MSQSRTRCIGMNVHQDTIAVAYIAQDYGAEGTALGTMGTQQCDLDHLIRKMPSKATHLILVYEAGPCGSWLSRYLLKKGYVCWGGALGRRPTGGDGRRVAGQHQGAPLAHAVESRLHETGHGGRRDGAQHQARGWTYGRDARPLSACEAPCTGIACAPLVQGTGPRSEGYWGVVETPAHPFGAPASVSPDLVVGIGPIDLSAGGQCFVGGDAAWVTSPRGLAW